MLSTETAKLLLPLARAHEDAGEYEKGHYGYGWNGKACSIGCTMHDAKMLGILAPSPSHLDLAGLLGVPVEICLLVDFIFEGMPEDQAGAWTPSWLEAIKPGRDYSFVGPCHAARCLRRCLRFIARGDGAWRVQWRASISAAISILEKGRHLTEAEAKEPEDLAQSVRAISDAGAEARWAAETAVSTAAASKIGGSLGIQGAAVAGAAMISRVFADTAEATEAAEIANAMRDAVTREYQEQAADLLELLRFGR